MGTAVVLSRHVHCGPHKRNPRIFAALNGAYARISEYPSEIMVQRCRSLATMVAAAYPSRSLVDPSCKDRRRSSSEQAPCCSRENQGESSLEDRGVLDHSRSG